MLKATASTHVTVTIALVRASFGGVPLPGAARVLHPICLPVGNCGFSGDFGVALPRVACPVVLTAAGAFPPCGLRAMGRRWR